MMLLQPQKKNATVVVFGCQTQRRHRSRLISDFDRWDQKVGFVFGYDAKANVIQMADALAESRWKPFERPARYEVKTEPRRAQGTSKNRLSRNESSKTPVESEQVAEFDYRPTQRRKTYRMVVVRKNLSVEKGEHRLFDEVPHFFYITNDRDMTAHEIVFLANDRCENVIEQFPAGSNFANGKASSF